MTATNKYGVFGGSFDPIHLGHVHLINQILNLGIFEKVIVIPAGDPWQKSPSVSAQQRLEMTQLALADLPVIVSNIEVLRNGASYAIDTVKELKSQFPNVEFTWIIGSDVANALKSWREVSQLAQEVSFLVIKRPNSQIEKSQIPDGIRFTELEIAALDISATEIRQALAEKRDVSRLIPASVAGFIQSKGLYGAA